jgi:hypothetical protein
LGQPVGRSETGHPRAQLVDNGSTLRASGRSVSKRTGVDHCDPPPGPTKDERRTQPGRSTADDRHVVGKFFRSDYLLYVPYIA